MRPSIVRAALAASSLVLGGCLSHPEPIIDTQHSNMANYEADLTECEGYGEQVRIGRHVIAPPSHKHQRLTLRRNIYLGLTALGKLGIRLKCVRFALADLGNPLVCVNFTAGILPAVFDAPSVRVLTIAPPRDAAVRCFEAGPP